MIDLTGRVALVTGAAGSIGRACCALFLEAGASVVAVDFSADGLAALESDLPGPLVTARGDVTDPDDAERCVATAVDSFGQLDILVSNAGITRDQLLFRMTEDEFDSVIATHMRGAFLFCRAAQARMVPRRSGKIVLISSRSALGNRGQTNYSGAKAGLIGMTRAMSIELGPFGVNVNAVAPGHVETTMTRQMAERMGQDYEAVKAEASAGKPLRRVAQPQDIANVVLFLASDLSSYVTGETIWVTGGPAGTW